MKSKQLEKANRKTVGWLTAIVLGMLLFAFAQVQLYGLFCQALGVDSLSARQPVNGEYTIDKEVTQKNPRATPLRYITVRFDATVNADLPWSFAPTQTKIKMIPGEYQQITYRVKNLTNETLVGQSIANVLPWQAQVYIQKMDCFCYDQQVLQAYEEKEMPVVFTLSPDIPQEVQSLVLSYTFLNAQKSFKPQIQPEMNTLPIKSNPSI